jgi:hypothetical protein
MRSDLSGIGDAMQCALDMARDELGGAFGIVGWGVAELRDGDGQIKQLVPFSNLVTDVGDSFYTSRAILALGSTTNIVSSTNASPIVVTATAHGLAAGDKVVVASHTTNTNANGTWVIGTVAANTLSLLGSTGNGVGGATGTVQGLAVPQASGMKLGTGSTAVAKNGAGAALVTYTTGSQQAFDATFPSAATKGAGAGWRVTYKVTYAAGTATASGLNEVVIVNENVLTNATTAAANTISRALLSPVVNKGASDTLTITWNHDALGA